MNNIEAYMNSLDTYIDVLKEESARLSDMITKLNDKIQEVETKKEQLIKEQNEPKFEIAKGEEYYYIDFLCNGFALAVQRNHYVGGFDKCNVDQNNCFKTEERAKEVLDKIKLLLKLERLHDIYCPDYISSWGKDNDEHKYCIYYDSVDNKYHTDWYIRCIHQPTVYFPTEVIAQKVCDALNREEQSNEVG